ncbi:MAG: GbsR/MarR family transcriptional regulator [Elusimicrobiota bacterium]
MNKDRNNIQLKFANAAGMLASRLSLSPIAGQIYGLLYMSPRPVSLNEMVEKLNISKGSASTNVRALESWNAVRKVWVDNTRKDYYEANPDTLSILTKRIKQGLKRRLDESKDKMEYIEKSIKKSKRLSKETDFYKKRVDKVKQMYNKVMQFLELLP